MLKTAGILSLGVVMLASVGCHMPHGGWFGGTGGSQTYYSTEARPTTINLIDVRTGESLFAMDIPPGKQLTIDLDEGEGDDPVHRPGSRRGKQILRKAESGLRVRDTGRAPKAFGEHSEGGGGRPDAS